MTQQIQINPWYQLSSPSLSSTPNDSKDCTNGFPQMKRIMRRKYKFITRAMKMEPGRLLVNSEVFEETFSPDILFGRDSQVEQFRLCLRPLLDNTAPLHALLFGKPGTGKTLLAKSLLTELTQRTTIETAYVNCWESPTLYTVTDRLVKHLRIFFAERTDTTYKIERLKQHLAKSRNQLVVVLDELDKATPRERNDILYNLVQLAKVSLVCITNSRSFFTELDERILSRFNPVHIECAPYASEQLYQILKARVEIGLTPGCVDDEILRAVADFSEGDARIALRTLKKAAQLAEMKPASRIEKDAVEKAFQEMRHVRRKYLLEKLTEHHRMIYSIVQGNPGISSTALREAYLRECDVSAMQAVAVRTFRTHLTRLLQLKLLKAQPELGGGGGRVFYVVE